MNFPDTIPAFPNDSFKDQYVPVFDLNSMQDVIETF